MRGSRATATSSSARPCRHRRRADRMRRPTPRPSTRRPTPRSPRTDRTDRAPRRASAGSRTFIVISPVGPASSAARTPTARRAIVGSAIPARGAVSGVVATATATPTIAARPRSTGASSAARTSGRARSAPARRRPGGASSARRVPRAESAGSARRARCASCAGATRTARRRARSPDAIRSSPNACGVHPMRTAPRRSAVTLPAESAPASRTERGG